MNGSICHPIGDTTAVRTDTEILPTLAEAGGGLRSLGGLGYEGEAVTITVAAFKKPKDGALATLQQQFTKANNDLRAIGDRDNVLLKTTFKTLRNVSLDPWRIGRIAALVIPTSTTPAPHNHVSDQRVARNGSWM